MTERIERIESTQPIHGDIVESELQLGSLSIYQPSEIVQRASAIATDLAQIINDRKLYTVIRRRKYVRVEGWTTLGAMLGVVPREVAGLTHELEDGSWEAWVELVRVSDGAVIGRGSAICSPDERNWRDREAYARRSMAVTRATGKAYRLGFSWIMTLAGYEPTPWEEMPGEEMPGDTAVSRPAPRIATGKRNGGRPLSPDKLRNHIQIKAAGYDEAGRSASDKQLNFVRMLLTDIFMDDDQRHTATGFLLGKTSTTELTDGEVLAMLDWIGPEKTKDDGYIPSAYSITEGQAVITAALKAEGQESLL